MFVQLCILVFLSYPLIRANAHDVWEMSHRYGGWSAVGTAWAQLFVLVFAEANTAISDEFKHQLGRALVTTPAFWMLQALTGLIIYRWLRTRKRGFEAEELSDHTIRLQFNHRKVSIETVRFEL